jgi:hypothetical protein
MIGLGARRENGFASKAPIFRRFGKLAANQPALKELIVNVFNGLGFLRRVDAGIILRLADGELSYLSQIGTIERFYSSQ